MTTSKHIKKKSGGNNNPNFNNIKIVKKEKDEKKKLAVDDLKNEENKLGNVQKDKEGKDVIKVIVNDPGIDEHPLKPGYSLIVKYRDGSHRLAKIIDKMKKIIEKKNVFSYYVHYNDFNRRMDEWVSSDRIVLLPSAANILAIEHAALHNHGHGESKSGEDQGNKKIARTVSTSRRRSSRTTGEPGEDEEEEEEKEDAVYNHVDSEVTTVGELEHDEHEGLDEASLLEHEEITKVKNVANVLFGKFKMECWYFSPFPQEFFPEGPVEFLHFCEFTFRFFCEKEELIRYQNKPALPRHPPGNEIYRDAKVSMFELDGAVEKVYCQNLCFFAKLFLDHKTLYWDVDPFLFYVMCTQDSRGYHPVGFFSKEKYSDLGYNLACILTFPSAQRQGYGRFLIAFSYELSKKEEKVGSPEKPLSDLGALSYKSYWASTILIVLKNYSGQHISVGDLSKMTSILIEDTAATLQMLGLIQLVNDEYVLHAPPAVIDDLILRFPANGLLVDTQQLHWSPLYVTDAKKDKWAIRAKKDLVGPGSGSVSGQSVDAAIKTSSP